MIDARNVREMFDEVRIQTMVDALSNAPPPAKKMTTKETLASLAEYLKTARDRGHTAASLADVLKAKGLKVSTRSVAVAMRDSAPTSSKTRKSSMRKIAPTERTFGA